MIHPHYPANSATVNALNAMDHFQLLVSLVSLVQQNFCTLINAFNHVHQDYTKISNNKNALGVI